MCRHRARVSSSSSLLEPSQRRCSAKTLTERTARARLSRRRGGRERREQQAFTGQFTERVQKAAGQSFVEAV